MDLYRIYAGINGVYVDQDQKTTPLSNLLVGWDSYNLINAGFGLKDLMHRQNELDITLTSGLQMSIAREQGIYSTMQEGIPNMSGNPEMNYKISVKDATNGADLTPEFMNAFGATTSSDAIVEHGNAALDALKDDNLKARTVGTTGIYDDVDNTYMIGIKVNQGGKDFTLPMPAILNYINRLRHPKPNEENDKKKLELNIELNKIDAVFDRFKNKQGKISNNLEIDITILTKNQIKEMGTQLGTEKGEILAKAELEINPSLFREKHQPVYMAWVVRQVR